MTIMGLTYNARIEIRAEELGKNYSMICIILISNALLFLLL